jgi:hypothetical protein
MRGDYYSKKRQKNYTISTSVIHTVPTTAGKKQKKRRRPAYRRLSRQQQRFLQKRHSHHKCRKGGTHIDDKKVSNSETRKKISIVIKHLSPGFSSSFMQRSVHWCSPGAHASAMNSRLNAASGDTHTPQRCPSSLQVLPRLNASCQQSNRHLSMEYQSRGVASGSKYTVSHHPLCRSFAHRFLHFLGVIRPTGSRYAR